MRSRLTPLQRHAALTAASSSTLQRSGGATFNSTTMRVPTPAVPRLTPEGIAMGRNDLTAPIEPKARALNGGVAWHPRLFEAKELLDDPMPEVLGNAWTGIRHGELQALWAFKTCRLPRRYADDDRLCQINLLTCPAPTPYAILAA